MAVPTLRFKQPDGKEYPAWKEVGLANIFREISEKNRTDLPVLSIKQGFGTVLRDESGINMVYSKSNLKNYKAIQRDDFIIHLRSFEGGLECSRYDGISSPAYKILRCNSTILPSLYKYYFRSRNFISNKLAKAVVGIRDGKNIDMHIFWKIAIPVACLEEQQRIANFIADVDGQIENYRQSLDNLESQKKELLRRVFSQELRFTKDDDSDYPDWRKEVFKNVFASFSYGMNAKATAFDGENKYIRITDIDDVSHKYDTKNIVSPDGALNDKYLVKERDILFARTGATVGKTYIYNSNDGKVYHAGYLIRGNVNIEYVPLFIYYVTLSDNYWKWVSSVSKGKTAQPGINSKQYESFEFLCPSYEEQQKISNFFSDLDERIELERQRLQTMQDLKKGLLQQMFC